MQDEPTPPTPPTNVERFTTSVHVTVDDMRPEIERLLAPIQEQLDHVERQQAERVAAFRDAYATGIQGHPGLHVLHPDYPAELLARDIAAAGLDGAPGCELTEWELRLVLFGRELATASGPLRNIPAVDLLAEVDRRARADRPPLVHFYGVWPGERAGHYRRDRNGKMTGGHDGFPARGALGLYPWDVWHGPAAPQTEGKFWHWHHPTEPFTLLLSWDRSADKRGGCAATFIVHAHVTAEHGLALARENFPAVFARIEAHLGRAVVLAGPLYG
jgi:hypothetical protein